MSCGRVQWRVRRDSGHHFQMAVQRLGSRGRRGRDGRMGTEEGNAGALRAFLTSLPPGRVREETLDKLEHLLVDSWDELDGSHLEGMRAYKLVGRMEEVEWRPPTLSFTIERHGGVMYGSSRAELQEWYV